MDDLTVCTVCGLPIEAHQTDLRFSSPDRLVESDALLPHGSWMSGPTPETSDLMVLPEVGAFIRSLFRIRIEGGVFLTYGLWIEVDRDQFDRAKDIWHTPDYAKLSLVGTLANKLPFKEASLAPVVAEVGDPTRTPVVISSRDPWTESLLDAVLSHDSLSA